MEEDFKISPENPYWDLIQEAYSAFRVPTPHDLEVCNACCMQNEKQDEMKKYVSQNVPLHLIEEWYSAASNYPVSQSIWCYILPRALEILAVGEMPAHSLEIVLSRYPTGQRSNWTQAQWQILDTFQKKFIQTDIKSSHESALGHSLDDKLCMFANSGWDIDDLFEQVYSLPIQSLVETLYEDWGFHRGYFQICVTQFWGDPKKIELKWTAKFLNDRLFDYGMAPTSPKPLADKALDLVDAISAYQNDWQ